MEEEILNEKRKITKEGLQKYEDELNYLKVERRAEVAQKIKEAREQGDLSENAEYDAAKDEQRDLEARISEIEAILKDVEVVTKKDAKRGTIGIGCHVTLLDISEDEELEYDIVGATEADSLHGKISNESPLGKQLINKKKGDIVEVVTQHSKAKFEILAIK